MSDGSPLSAAEYAQLPTIAVGIAEPKTHVFRSGRFRADFVTWIFYIRADALQMLERFPQRRHFRNRIPCAIQVRARTISRFLSDRAPPIQSAQFPRVQRELSYEEVEALNG